ncbi:AraC family transcriptional regulator [Pseudomonas sp. LP_7_YM]|uniref:helix-turn-helix transcriptional regulator n=1 Tax=Pseudomonas sp. LP_7_YM TaxID=2485137 RepID=UPI00105BFA2A|nr:AraC family transcriptional regulator [Pseudomonas sp. LP_7_YM]TDV72591.1 AraC family transcriptional regulator [Pseudomonas sp. LP_7_YM]
MNAIDYIACDNTLCGDFNTEASLVQKDFDIRLEQATWPADGMALVETHGSCLIRLLLTDEPQRPRPVSNRGSFGGRNGEHFKPLGSLLFIPPDTSFHLAHDARRQKALICLFNPATLGPLAAWRWDWDACIHDSMLNVQNPFMRASLQRLAEEVSAPGFASELHSEYLLTGIALDLRREYLGRQVATRCDGKLSPLQLRRITEVLNAAVLQQPSLHDMAQLCELSVRRLSQCFKNTTGLTLRRYAAQARINRAKALLSDPRWLVKQVAYQSGFQNAAAFTAAFRKETGLTPEQFRLLR